MRLVVIAGVCAAALLTSACQSEKAGLEVVCNAPRECGECKDVAPDQRMLRLAQHIENNLSNSKVKEMFQALAAAAPEAKHKILTERAKALGLASCPLADEIASNKP